MRPNGVELGAIVFLLSVCPQTYADTECTKTRADITFLIDSSSSINEESPKNFDLLKTFVKNVISRFPLGTDNVRVAVIQYSTNAKLLFKHDKYKTKKELDNAIDRMPYLRGNTNTAAAIKMLNGLHDRKDAFNPSVSRVGLLITDGLSNLDSNTTMMAAREAKKDNIRLFTVGIGKHIHQGELEEIASDPITDHNFVINNFKNLNSLLSQVIGRVCNLVSPPVAKCIAKADLTFVIDDSGSIRDKNPKDKSYDNWALIKDFVKRIVDSMQIGYNETRVALVKYSDEARIQFYLNQYFTTAEVKKAIEGMAYLAGGTNIAEGIHKMRTEIFRETKGDRPDVRNVAVLVTDGESTFEAEKTLAEALSAKGSNISIFAVGVTNKVNEEQMKSIASEPAVDHYFNSTEITQLVTLLNQLVVHVCEAGCQPVKPIVGDDQLESKLSEYGPGSCPSADRLGQGKCPYGKVLSWVRYPKKFIVGHNNLRLTYIRDFKDCQRICLDNEKCKSIDYVSNYRECALSKDTKDKVGINFQPDSEADHYEWRCLDVKGLKGQQSNFTTTTEKIGRTTRIQSAPGSKEPDSGASNRGLTNSAIPTTSCIIIVLMVAFMTSCIHNFYWTS